MDLHFLLEIYQNPGKKKFLFKKKQTFELHFDQFSPDTRDTVIWQLAENGRKNFASHIIRCVEYLADKNASSYFRLAACEEVVRTISSDVDFIFGIKKNNWNALPQNKKDEIQSLVTFKRFPLFAVS